MGLIDSHAHLTDQQLVDDVAGVLDRAAQTGVSGVVTIGSDVTDSMAAVDLAQRFENVWATVGIHPHEAEKVTPDDWLDLEQLLTESKVVAAGEIGLDYHYDFVNPAHQYAVLERQLEMIASTTLPLVIHARKSINDVVELLAQKGFAGRKAVFHCFTGTAAEAQRIVEHGWQVSFTGVVTYRSSAQLHELIRNYPADRIMLETDAPYLSPVPIRHVKPNEPAYLVHTAEFVARLRGQPFEELAAQTQANTRAFFSLPAG